MIVLTDVEIRVKFEELISGQLSREDVANFALSAMLQEDHKNLDLQPSSKRSEMWKALHYLCGVDLRVSKDEYFHENEDFKDFFSGLNF